MEKMTKEQHEVQDREAFESYMNTQEMRLLMQMLKSANPTPGQLDMVYFTIFNAGINYGLSKFKSMMAQQALTAIITHLQGADEDSGDNTKH